jgi:hypothetical protein
MTDPKTKFVCGEQQGVHLTVEELCYVADKSFVPHSASEKQTAVAIALAESGGWTGCVGDCNIGFSLGLWQIHVPAWKSTISYGGDAFNAYDNAAMAEIVYQHGGWKNWSTYNDNSYQQYVSQVQSAWNNRTKPGTVKPTANTNPTGSALPGKAGDAVNTANSFVGDIGTGVGDATAKLGQLLEYVAKTAAWISNPHNWLRILYVGLGAAVTITGLAKLIAYDDGLAPVGALAKQAKAAVPQSKRQNYAPRVSA